MPHKDMALKLSEPDERALAVGAANTLWLEDGTLKSTNTDVEGFIGALDESAPGWDEGLQKAVVMGAGGAARAVVYGFIERGVPRIHVVNRTLSKAEAFRERFGPSVVPTSFDDLPGALEGAGLVANATSLGMEGFPDLADRSVAHARGCGGGGRDLRAARDLAPQDGQSPGHAHLRRARHAAASGGARLRTVVRRFDPR